MSGEFIPRLTGSAFQLGFGDTSSYLLSTAEDALGVIWGRCPDGHKMTPLNDQELHCATCGMVESRKIAKLSSAKETIDSEMIPAS